MLVCFETSNNAVTLQGRISVIVRTMDHNNDNNRGPYHNSISWCPFVDKRTSHYYESKGHAH